MSSFVFTLVVKPPKPSSLWPGREMITIRSNVRIPDWVLNKIADGWPEVRLEKLAGNKLIIVHTSQWLMFGDKFLGLLVRAPSNSRRHFPAQIIVKERHTGKVLDWVQYPIIHNW